VVEVVIERDEGGKVAAVTLRGDDSPEGLAAACLVEAPVLGLKDYLHLDPQVEGEGPNLAFRVDRSDFFLDREVDAILETMVLGLRTLERRRPERLAVREFGTSVKV